jgi:hypothetical protein
VIELSGVSASYGNVPAIDGVTINVGEVRRSVCLVQTVQAKARPCAPSPAW